MRTPAQYGGCLYLAVCFLVFGLAFSTASRPPEGRTAPQPSAATVDNSTFININQILMFVTNHGNLGRDLDGVFGDDWGTIYPYTSVANIEAGATWPAGLWRASCTSSTTSTWNDARPGTIPAKRSAAPPSASTPSS